MTPFGIMDFFLPVVNKYQIPFDLTMYHETLGSGKAWYFIDAILFQEIFWRLK
jgi:hypothetical protein